MKIIVTKNYEELGKLTSEYLLGLMLSKQNRMNIAITAGKTPEAVYEYLVPKVKDKDYLSHVHYYNFDEIPFKVTKTAGITMRDLQNLFFVPANIPTEQIHPLDENNYLEQDKRLVKDGGLDAILLGIGADGHYCGNLPGTTSFEDFTSRVDCSDERLRNRIKRHFDNEEDIPDYYITMGPRSIMSANRLILIANGIRKAEIMKEFIHGKVNPDIPASILRMHPGLTVIMDEEAASLSSK